MINFINNENVKKMIINTNTYIHIEIYENSASFFFRIVRKKIVEKIKEDR